MNPKHILCLALVLSGSLFGFAQYSTPLTVPGADASVREEYHVHVPTQLNVRQTNGVLHLWRDRSSLEITNLTVGTNMMMAMWCDVYVYPASSSRPTNYCHNLEPDIGAIRPDASIAEELYFDTEPYYWRPDGKGIAEPATSMVPWIHTHEGSVVAGTKYNVEMDLTIFETDTIKISRFWNPQSAGYYKILWQRTLKQTFN
jgi:hypothetical protein